MCESVDFYDICTKIIIQFKKTLNSVENSKKKKKRLKKLNDRYRLVMLKEHTFEERFSMKITGLNVLVVITFTIIIIATGTFFLISKTGLKEYIPGYTEVQFKQDLYQLTARADSLEQSMKQKEAYLNNLYIILSDSTVIENIYGVDTINNKGITSTENANIIIENSAQDSLLRAEFEEATRYNLKFRQSEDLYNDITSAANFLFYQPVEGTMTSPFDPINKHYGIDLVTRDNEPVLATLDGTVIMSNWTVETGYVIAIQHRHELISVYKHNAVLLKKQGDYVEAGEAIAIVGESGEVSTGPHLHFEVWYRGNPMNPAKFLNIATL